MMNTDAPDLQIAAAREAVLSWLQVRQPGQYDSNEELAAGFLRFIATDTTLELKIQRNPSACVFEARWYDGGREIPEFRKPFSAEVAADAKVLACAALLTLDG